MYNVKELIEKIENLEDGLELQHPEFSSGYSMAIIDVVGLVKKLDLCGVRKRSFVDDAIDEYVNKIAKEYREVSTHGETDSFIAGFYRCVNLFKGNAR